MVEHDLLLTGIGKKKERSDAGKPVLYLH